MKVSICVPQYNRCRFLLKSLESIRHQTFRDFEVVISDDASTDETKSVIPDWLRASGLRHKFFRQPKNLGYDANLRAAMNAAEGDYLFILGNDDGLPDERTLARFASLVDDFKQPELVIGTFFPARDPTALSNRAPRTEIVGSGPAAALQIFRTLTCVTGLAFSREAFHAHDTAEYDGSIYVQMFIGSRIVASGGRALAVAEPLAETNLEVNGPANSYRAILKDWNWTIRPATGGLDQVGRVVSDAILPYCPDADRPRIMADIYRQLLVFSYSYWMYDYRKNGAWWAALNLSLGCFPPALMRPVGSPLSVVARTMPAYLGATAVGLFAPLFLTERIKDSVRRMGVRRI